MALELSRHVDCGAPTENSENLIPTSRPKLQEKTKQMKAHSPTNCSKRERGGGSFASFVVQNRGDKSGIGGRFLQKSTRKEGTKDQ